MKTIQCDCVGCWPNTLNGQTYLQVFVVRTSLNKKNFHIHSDHFTQTRGDEATVILKGNNRRKVLLKIGGAR